MTGSNLKVSVCTCAYNHEGFIAKALDSVLMQETEFDLELLVGEDESTDGTREIVKEYARKHPSVIRLFLNDRKNVIKIAGRATGRWNLVNLLNQAEGKYIAVLDGDDYWTKKDKIRTQVEFLEENSDYAFCFHDVEVVDENGGILNTYCSNELSEGEIHQSELFKRCVTQFGSVLFRASAVTPTPYARDVRSFDWLLYIIASEHGKIHYSKDVASAYRMHQGGIWQSMSHLDMLRGEINSLQNINRFFNSKYNEQIDSQIRKLEVDINVEERVQQEIGPLCEQLEATREGLKLTQDVLGTTQHALDSLHASKWYRLSVQYKNLKEFVLKTFIGKSKHK